MPIALIVDDEPAVMSLYRLTFEDAGFDVLTAATVEEGKRLCRTACPALLIVDHGLPDGDGLDLLREARTHCQPPRTILTSGAITPEQAEAAAALGAQIADKLDGPRELVRMAQQILGIPTSPRRRSSGR